MDFFPFLPYHTVPDSIRGQAYKDLRQEILLRIPKTNKVEKEITNHEPQKKIDILSVEGGRIVYQSLLIKSVL